MNKSSICLLPLLFIPLSASVSASLTSDKPHFIVGLVSQYAPEYAGSDKYESYYAPYFSWRYNSFKIDAAQGISYLKAFSNGTYVGQSLGYSLGRSDSAATWLRDGSEKLKGMGKIKSAMTTTSKFGWWMAQGIRFEGNVIAPLTDSQGLQYNLKLDVVVFESHDDTLLFNVQRNYGDARYNNTWYGVEENQSVLSGFEKYRAGSGLNNTDYGIDWRHSFSDAWTGYANAHYTVLADRIRKSPLVNKDDFLTFTLGVSYSF